MYMKRFLPLALVLAPTMLFAEQPDEAVVQWKQVVGVITAPNINNPVAGIASGAGPWSVLFRAPKQFDGNPDI